MKHVRNVSKRKSPAPAVLLPAKKSVESDRRLKRKVVAMRDALNTLLRLRGVTFEYNDAGKQRGCPTGARIGMIAQDVEQVIPEWVQVADDGYCELIIHGFEALIVEALRELQAENTALHDELAELKNLVRELRDANVELAEH